jgi:hypothetical protein
MYHYYTAHRFASQLMKEWPELVLGIQDSKMYLQIGSKIVLLAKLSLSLSHLSSSPASQGG